MDGESGLKNTIIFLIFIAFLSGCAGTGSTTQPAGQGKDSGAYNADRTASRVKTHTDLGAAYLQDRQYAIALEEFNEAIRIDPNYAAAYNGLGLLYSSLGQMDKAEVSFRKGLAINPNDSEAHNNMGNFLCQQNKIDDAIKEYMIAISNPLYPTPQLAYGNAGICAMKKNDSKAAETYFFNALRIDPLLQPAALGLSRIYFARGQYEQAIAALQNALIAAPTPEILWQAIQIERKRGNTNAADNYGNTLKARYPNSPEARALLFGK